MRIVSMKIEYRIPLTTRRGELASTPYAISIAMPHSSGKIGFVKIYLNCELIGVAFQTRLEVKSRLLVQTTKPLIAI